VARIGLVVSESGARADYLELGTLGSARGTTAIFELTTETLHQFFGLCHMPQHCTTKERRNILTSDAPS
jgi:hypothetical protein